MLRISWTSDKATNLNREIFENIYYAAVTESANIAKRRTGSFTYSYRSL
jgi:ribonucleotide reductase alpha subunit